MTVMERNERCFCISMRFPILLLTCGVVLAQGAMYMSLNFSKTCIFGSSAEPNFYSPCVKFNKSASESDQAFKFASIKWENVETSFVFEAYGWGLLVGVLPVGCLIQLFGLHKIYAVLLMLGSLSSLVTPIALKKGPVLTILMRFFQGLSTSAMWNAIIYVSVMWAGPNELGMFVSAGVASWYFGELLTKPIAVAVCHLVEWKFTFYLVGTVATVLFFIWLPTFEDSPENSSRVSTQERRRILDRREAIPKCETWRNLPLLSIISSLPTLAVAACYFSHMWGLALVRTLASSHFDRGNYFNRTESEIYSNLPLIGLIFGSIISGVLSDFIDKNTANSAITTKIFNSISFLMASVFLLVLVFIPCGGQPGIVVVCLVGANFSLALGTAGFIKSFSTLSLNYVSLLSAECSFAGFLAVVGLPAVLKALVPTGSAAEWHLVCYITIALMLTSLLLFLVLGQTQRQPWDFTKPLEEVSVSNSISKDQVVIIRL